MHWKLKIKKASKVSWVVLKEILKIKAREPPCGLDLMPFTINSQSNQWFHQYAVDKFNSNWNKNNLFSGEHHQKWIRSNFSFIFICTYSMWWKIIPSQLGWIVDLAKTNSPASMWFLQQSCPEDLFQNQWLIQEHKNVVGIGNPVHFSRR